MSDTERPDAFIQWKGTDACLDIYCACGEQFHFDGYFAYELTCGYCGQTYELPDTLRICPVEPSRLLTLVLDEQEVIRDGEFQVRWPRAAFDAVAPGATFIVRDENQAAYVTFIRAEPAGDEAMMLTVRKNRIRP